MYYILIIDTDLGGKGMNNKARKIKVIVIDPKSDKKIRIPAMHFGFISFIVSLALLFKPLVLRNSKLDDDTINIINAIDMIKEIINEFKSFGPFDLVDISTGDGTKVKISIL